MDKETIFKFLANFFVKTCALFIVYSVSTWLIPKNIDLKSLAVAYLCWVAFSKIKITFK